MDNSWFPDTFGPSFMPLIHSWGNSSSNFFSILACGGELECGNWGLHPLCMTLVQMHIMRLNMYSTVTNSRLAFLIKHPEGNITWNHSKWSPWIVYCQHTLLTFYTWKGYFIQDLRRCQNFRGIIFLSVPLRKDVPKLF